MSTLSVQVDLKHNYFIQKKAVRAKTNYNNVQKCQHRISKYHKLKIKKKKTHGEHFTNGEYKKFNSLDCYSTTGIKLYPTK